MQSIEISQAVTRVYAITSDLLPYCHLHAAACACTMHGTSPSALCHSPRTLAPLNNYTQVIDKVNRMWQRLNYLSSLHHQQEAELRLVNQPGSWTLSRGSALGMAQWLVAIFLQLRSHHMKQGSNLVCIALESGTNTPWQKGCQRRTSVHLRS